jgi:hypothetical protein
MGVGGSDSSGDELEWEKERGDESECSDTGEGPVAAGGDGEDMPLKERTCGDVGGTTAVPKWNPALYEPASSVGMTRASRATAGGLSSCGRCRGPSCPVSATCESRWFDSLR